jgi:hypothetical protein
MEERRKVSVRMAAVRLKRLNRGINGGILQTEALWKR